MVTPEELVDEQDYQDILEDIREEVSHLVSPSKMVDYSINIYSSRPRSSVALKVCEFLDQVSLIIGHIGACLTINGFCSETRGEVEPR